MIDFIDLAQSNRASAGRAPLTTDSGKSNVMYYNYRVILQDKDQTSKEIKSLELHQVGDEILDLETGIIGKVTRVERTTQRL